MNIESGIAKITFDIGTPYHTSYRDSDHDSVLHRFYEFVEEFVDRMELADVFGELSEWTGYGVDPKVFYSGGDPETSGVLIKLPPNVASGHLALVITGEGLWRWSEATGRTVADFIGTVLALEGCTTTVREAVVYVDYIDSCLTVDGLLSELDDDLVYVTRFWTHKGYSRETFSRSLKVKGRRRHGRSVEIDLDSPAYTGGIHLRVLDVKAEQTLDRGPGLERALGHSSWIRFELRLNGYLASRFQRDLAHAKCRDDRELAVILAGEHVSLARFRVAHGYDDYRRRDFTYWYKDLVEAFSTRSVSLSPCPMAFKIEDALLGFCRPECRSALNWVADAYGRDAAHDLLDFVLGFPGRVNLRKGPFDWGSDDSKRYTDKFKSVNDLKESIRNRALLFARCIQGQGE